MPNRLLFSFGIVNDWFRACFYSLLQKGREPDDKYGLVCHLLLYKFQKKHKKWISLWHLMDGVVCCIRAELYISKPKYLFFFFFWISISNSPMHSAKNILTIQQRIIITHTYWICLAKTKFKWQIDVEQIYFTIISSPFEMRVLRTTFADSIRVHLQVKRNSIVIGYFNNLTWRLNLS